MVTNVLQLCNIRSGCLVLGLTFTLTSLFPLATFSRDSLEERIVTREETLQDVPVTESAFTESALEERGIASLQDIADHTPDFAVILSHHERDGEYDDPISGNPPGPPATDNAAGGEDTDSVTAVLTL